MIKWLQNDRYFKTYFFLPFQKQGHSSSFHHSFVIWEWQGMITTMERYHSIVILVIFTSFWAIFSFINDDGMTEWGEMKGYFRTKAKPLILKFISFLHHSVIPSQYLIHDTIIPLICWSFLLLEVILVSLQFPRTFFWEWVLNDRNDLWMV